MYTTVKVKVEAKRKLEELQARLRLHGVKARLHEILEKLIEMGVEEEDRLLSKFTAEAVEEDPMLKLLDKPVDWGIKDASIKIDEALYGGLSGSPHRYRDICSSEK